MKPAVFYARTSSATNVGDDKDTLARQRATVEAYATRHGYRIVADYYDAAVSGADPVDSRAGFSDMLAKLLSNGCRTILIENASRFARDLIVQETGYRMLKAQGIELVPVDCPTHFADETPTSKLVRQILGAVAEFEKAALVAKLKGARDRKSKKLGHRIEGAHWMREQETIPTDHVTAAQKLHKAGLSLREIAERMHEKGISSKAGTVYSAKSVARMIKRT